MGASDAAADLETGTIVTAPGGSTEEPLSEARYVTSAQHTLAMS